MKTEAYWQGQRAYSDWFEQKGSTCIDGSEPNNPYPDGTPEAEDWDDGRWDCKQDCVLSEMGR